MPKLQASWIHGVAVQPEQELYSISKQRTGYAAIFRTHGAEWFHFAIPTPVITDGQHSTVKKVFMLYKTEGTAKITAVHVYDAGAKIFAIDNLTLTGDHSQNLDSSNTWLVTPHPMTFGLGISVHVDFGDATPGGVPSIRFTTAGADFETP